VVPVHLHLHRDAADWSIYEDRCLGVLGWSSTKLLLFRIASCVGLRIYANTALTKKKTSTCRAWKLIGRSVSSSVGWARIDFPLEPTALLVSEHIRSSAVLALLSPARLSD